MHHSRQNKRRNLIEPYGHACDFSMPTKEWNAQKHKQNKYTYSVTLDNLLPDSGKRPRHGKAKLTLDFPVLQENWLWISSVSYPTQIMLKNDQVITRGANLCHTGNLNYFVSLKIFSQFFLSFCLHTHSFGYRNMFLHLIMPSKYPTLPFSHRKGVFICL